MSASKNEDPQSSNDKKSSSKSDDDKEESSEDLESLFCKFAKFGDRESDGSTITLKNIDKWLKQAKVLSNKKSGITTVDTAITFSKIVKTKKRMSFDEFKEFIETLASDKKKETDELAELLTSCGTPSMTNVTSPVDKGKVGANLKRMTDTKLYTGAHKARFDEEGKGKGIEGRVDRQSSSGYVTGYKNQESQDKMHDSKNKDSDKEDKREEKNKESDKKDKKEEKNKDSDKKDKKEEKNKDNDKDNKEEKKK